MFLKIVNKERTSLGYEDIIGLNNVSSIRISPRGHKDLHLYTQIYMVDGTFFEDDRSLEEIEKTLIIAQVLKQ